MQKKRIRAEGAAEKNVVFRQALEPLEAAVLPAAERRRYGLLPMVPRAFDAPLRPGNQRAKIWVR